MKLSIYQYNSLILFLLLWVLPVDMLNGVLLQNNVNLPISISQLYKILILVLMLIRIFGTTTMTIIYFAFITFCLGSVIQSLSSFRFNFIFQDFIKTTKYLSILIAFFYFKRIFQENNSKTIEKVFKWLEFSYWVLAFNIVIKLVHLGYPMYEYGEIGTKGFFYAGNEISSLLLVTYGIIAHKILIVNQKRIKFFFFFLFNVFLAILISSKTSVLGILVISFFLYFGLGTYKVNLTAVKRLLVSIGIIIPMVLFFMYKTILNLPIIVRLQYFWEKLDFVTFIFSSRNLEAKKMFTIYNDDFTIVQKLIGGGQYFYESKTHHIVEIDLLDIFFAYGILGALLFCFFITLLLAQSYTLKKTSKYPFANLTFLMSLVLFVISSIAGHIYNSGIAGNFIALLFAMMYIKKNERQVT